jgi:predicted Zn-dependent protease
MRREPLSLFTEATRPGALPRADEPFLSATDAKALIDKALSFATSDEVRIDVRSGWTGNTRFARGEITTSGGTTDTTVTVTATVGKRRASTSTNILEADGLKRSVELATRLAKLSPEDPELMPELGPQKYLPVESYFQKTADLNPEVRAAATKKVFDAIYENKSVGELFVAGFMDVNANAIAIGTNKGLFAYHKATDVRLSTTARTPDATGSGWAQGAGRDWATIDPVLLGRTAAQKAVTSRNATAIEPGLYTVVLEPAAVAQLVPAVVGAFDARSADEGRSPFSQKGGGTKVGEKIADERVTLYTDPADPDILAQPFDNDGLPLGRRVWVENGVLKNLNYSRFWAQKQGKQATGGGGGRGGGGGGGGGGGAGLKMVGGSKSTAELIGGCERGILVTHFFYVNSLDPRTVMLTGLTRDGMWLIENGKVTKPLRNFRWMESPLFMLSKIEEIGKAEHTGVGQMLPALRVKDFNMASLSDAI